MEIGKRKRNNNTKRESFGLTIRKQRLNVDVNEYEPGRCGSLEPDETCLLRPKGMGEQYGSLIYFIRKGNKETPVKIRKLGTSAKMPNGNIRLETFRGIQKEGRVYESLRKLNAFSQFCLPFLKYTEDGSIRYIDFEYLPGETVFEYVNKEERGLESRKKILGRCIEALLFLAENGYIHGDVKLDNFWWDSEKKTVRVFDFELAKREPPIEDFHSTVSLMEEMGRIVDLLQLKTEFGFPAKVVEELLGDTQKIFERIESSPTKGVGLERLIEVYKGILGKLDMRGGSRLRNQTRRKNRRNK